MKKVGKTQKGVLTTQAIQSEGEPLHIAIARIIATGAGIEKVAETLHTGEYQPGGDIRTDRWEVALDALIKVDKARYQQQAKKEAEEALKKASTEKPVTINAEDVHG